MDQFTADNEANQDLINLMHFFGSWDELKERVQELEDAQNEAVFEQRYSY